MRFDMSGFAQSHEVGPLVGTPPAYRGAQPGLLTQFVKDNPTAMLLFDEIEKAHITAIHLFLQLLDAGRLQDRNTEETVTFQDCIILFTTNAGRRLYETEDGAGVSLAQREFHRATILDALRSNWIPRPRPHFFLRPSVHPWDRPPDPLSSLGVARSRSRGGFRNQSRGRTAEPNLWPSFQFACSKFQPHWCCARV